MTRIEDELRSLYADLPGAREVEARILAAFADRPGHPAAHFAEPPSPRRAALRWTAVGVSAATVAAIGVGVITLTDHPHPATTGAGGSTAGPTPAGFSTDAAPPTPATVTVTPQVIAQTLISLLPRPGRTTDLSGQSSGSDNAGEAGAELVYDDGDGAARISVLLQFADGSGAPASASLCPSDPMPTQHCSTEPDGSQFGTYQGDANIPGGATEWDVSLLRKDGVLIDVTEWNSPSEKGGAQTRTDPPFTMSELSAIVHSGDWQATVPAATARQAAHLFTPQRS